VVQKSEMKQKIHSQRCWIDGKLQEATITITNRKIEEIVKGAEASNDVEDLGNLVVMPGVIDAHVHVNEPGRTDWEGFDTATQAAVAGGITTIIDMPLNASPVTTTIPALQQKLESTRGKLHVNCGFYGGIVPGNLSDIEGLINKGVFGIKAFLTHSGIDEFPNVGAKELDDIMPLLAKYRLPLLVHCELSDDDHGRQLHDHPTSYKAYLESRPKEWENRAIGMMIDLCRKHQCPVHIVHVSSAVALRMIEKAKQEGLPLTAETCPHYIYFNAEDIPDGQTIYKCAPPIREKANNNQLKTALKNGVLDFLATDHSPAPPGLKNLDSGNLLTAWGGIAGLQFLLSAGWTAMKSEMTVEQFIPLVTEKPAAFLHLQNRKGFIRKGFDADLVCWQPEESFDVKPGELFHKHKISPYVSRRLSGKVKRTWVNGEEIFNGEHIINKNQGQCLLRT
jgi:allantoinase